VDWTHVAQDGSGNSATDGMGSFGDSSLKAIVLLLRSGKLTKKYFDDKPKLWTTNLT